MNAWNQQRYHPIGSVAQAIAVVVLASLGLAGGSGRIAAAELAHEEPEMVSALHRA